MNSLKLCSILSLFCLLPSVVEAQINASINGTFSVTESWTVKVYRGRGVTKTHRGIESGKVVISEGAYQQINHSGAGGIGRLHTSRTIDFSGGYYEIGGGYPVTAFASGPGGFYAIVQLNFFIIKIDLGDNAGFSSLDSSSSEIFTSRGSTLLNLAGSGVYRDINAPSDIAGYFDGADVSSTTGLTLAGATEPRISPQPQSRFVEAGSDAVFTVAATGTAPLAYQWRHGTTMLADGGNISGATSPTLTISGAQSVDAGAYSVVVTNPKGSVASATATLRIGAILTVQTNGAGVVTPVLNGQLLEIGRSFTLTARPGAGFLFSNWTGGLPASDSPRLTFTMPSNLTLSANFVPNPFLPVAGMFSGLFRNPSAAEHVSSGSFKAKVQAGGAFSATLQMGGRRLPFAGRFGLDGKATNVVARRGTNALTVELCLKFDGSEELSGRVTDGLWSSALLADRAVFSTLANPATNFARQYTLLIPGGTNGSVMEPAGDGFASVSVSRAGLTTIKGTLADGTPAALAVPVSKGGDVPLYLSLYGGAGSASGWLRVLPSSEIDLNGEVAWFKPARPGPGIYTNGFALGLPVSGSIYTPFGTNRLFDAEMAAVAFTEGGLMDAFTNVVTLGPNGRVTNASLMNKLTLRAVSGTGLFTGFVVPLEGTKPVPFKGVLLQRQGYGGGFFLNAGQSGQVWLGP